MDLLACGNLSLYGVKEANELLMPMMLRAAADNTAFQHVQRGEQRGGAVPDVVMGPSAAASLLQGRPWLSAVGRLDLALFVD
jgi:hypothetical protein